MNNAEQVQKLMDLLGISEDEALEVLDADKAIDRGQRTEFDLSPTEERNALKQAHAGMIDSKPKAQSGSKRERKVDESKRYLLACLVSALEPVAEVTIVNPERELTFTYNNKKYKVVLSAPRT